MMDTESVIGDNTDTLNEVKEKEYQLNHMNSDLYNAVITDKVDALKKIMGRLNVGDQLTPTNSTVLHLACQYESIKCVTELLREHSPLLLQSNLRGETALHLAARHGHFHVAVALINAAKTLVSLPEEEELKAQQFTYADQIISDQPMFHAAAPSSSQMQVFPDMDPSLISLIRCTDLEGETALHLAVRYNRENVVLLLVQHDPGHSYSPNNFHETPLYLASVRHYSDIISTILDNCKSPTFGGPDGKTALHAAVFSDGGSECVKVLFLKGNTHLVEVQDNYGWTAFHFVAYNNLYKIVKDLVSAEDKCDGYKSVGYRLDKKKRTALHVAACAGSVGVMVELVKYYPDSWDIVDGSGRNILHIAVEQNRLNVIHFILSKDSKTSNSLLSQRDHQGNTPLHLIAKSATYVPKLMSRQKVDWKIDWEVTDNNNLTPLDVLTCRRETDSLRHTVKVAGIHRILTGAKVLDHRKLWSTQEMSDLKSDLEMGEKIRRNYDEIGKLFVSSCREALNTHMIVVALIATVALTAGLGVPGGFVDDEGPTQGHPQLLKRAAFKAFMVTDAITVLSSVTSLLLYFATTMKRRIRTLKILVLASALLGGLSLITMMLAFGAGTYAMLAPSPALAISVCVIAFLFPLYYFIHFSFPSVHAILVGHFPV